MDYLLIFIFCHALGFLITLSFLLKKAKVITMTDLLQGTFSYGFTFTLIVGVSYYLFN